MNWANIIFVAICVAIGFTLLWMVLLRPATKRVDRDLRGQPSGRSPDDDSSVRDTLPEPDER